MKTYLIHFYNTNNIFSTTAIEANSEKEAQEKFYKEYKEGYVEIVDIESLM